MAPNTSLRPLFYKLNIHASITAGNTTPPLLGKKDILDRRYNLIIDSVKKVTILKRNP